jgi:hypothetical protein
MAPISESFIAHIEDGQRLRGWIANAYAQIEFLLGDLILRCRTFPEYEIETARFPHTAVERAGRVRRMLQKDGCLRPFATELASILDRFDERRETRNLFAHGFCVYVYTPDGDAGLRFQMFHRHAGRDEVRIEYYRFSDLDSEKISLVALSEEAIRLFIRIHKHFGWNAQLDGG